MVHATMTGQELKDLLAMIPNKALVSIGGSPFCKIEGVTLETCFDSIYCDIKLTPGYSITCDNIIDSLFEDLKKTPKK